MAILIALAQVVVAAPSKHRKPKRAKPATTSVPSARPDPEPAESTSAADEAPAADSGAAAPPEPAPREDRTRPRAPAEPGDDGPLESAPRKHASPNSPPKTDTTLAIEDSRDDDLLARRESARIAAGRVEVAVSAGIDVGRRHFTFSDPIGAQPRPYLLKATPLWAFGLETYPLASTGVPFLQDLGFRGRVSRAFALDSSTTDGVTIETSWMRFGGEVRERVLLRGQRPIELGVVAGVDASYFGMTAKGTVGALVPSARTLALRFGADTQWAVTRRLSLLAGGAYLSTTTRGEIYDRFRRPRVAGVDAELGGAVGLSPGLEARLTFRYTRYFASFKPEVGDTAVAGGALDEQMQVGMGIRYAH